MNVQEALNLLKENGYKYTNKREDMLQLLLIQTDILPLKTYCLH